MMVELVVRTVPLETTCAFTAVLLRSKRRFNLRFDRGQTASTAT